MFPRPSATAATLREAEGEGAERAGRLTGGRVRPGDPARGAHRRGAAGALEAPRVRRHGSTGLLLLLPRVRSPGRHPGAAGDAGEAGREGPPALRAPPAQAPAGGHGPETVWHITTKHLLAAWARFRPGVDRVRLEQWTEDHDRRADGEVLLRDGTKIALEAQRKLMTDDGWRARHRDYARQGVVDVWFWRPRVHFPHVVLDEGLPVWFYSVSKREAATSLGRPHARAHQWWQASDLSVFGLHHPPCALDELERVTMPLAVLGLGPGGAVLPEDLRKRVLDSQREAQEEAKQRKDGEARYARQVREARDRAARVPAPLPPPPVPAGGLRCEVCRRPLDPLLVKNRRHLLC
ncbi:competence protein CoiA family protein [Streptomyces virginiae]|uniref:competence protein CoiA family protein n=1 Tax=Streptomyces virginiae TaxID=1961 RepID=UPI00406289C7